MSIDIMLTGLESKIALLLCSTIKSYTYKEIAEEFNTTIELVEAVHKKISVVEELTGDDQIIEKQGDLLINEALVFVPNESICDNETATQIAIWCAKKMKGNLAKSAYWDRVIEYLQSK